MEQHHEEWKRRQFTPIVPTISISPTLMQYTQPSYLRGWLEIILAILFLSALGLLEQSQITLPERDLFLTVHPLILAIINKWKQKEPQKVQKPVSQCWIGLR